MIDQIHWLGHASFRIDSTITVYIDPWKLSKGPPADLVLVTHDHFDHFSPADIEKVRTDDTVIVGPAPCAGIVQPMRVMRPLDAATVAGVRVEAVPAYNIGKRFHPKSDERVGYIITLDGEKIYHAGDTDRIPEMRDITCDIALLPVSGTYVMTADEAVGAVSDIGCRIAVPMHWGDIIGSKADAERFAEKASCEVRILHPER